MSKRPFNVVFNFQLCWFLGLDADLGSLTGDGRRDGAEAPVLFGSE
jgi:hypothetical protein